MKSRFPSPSPGRNSGVTSVRACGGDGKNQHGLISGESGKSGRGVGRFAGASGHAAEIVVMRRAAEYAVEPWGKGIGKGFAMGCVQECDSFSGTTGATALDNGDLASLLFFAAISEGRFLMDHLFHLLLAATGMVDAFLGRTAADITAAGTLSGHGMGQLRVAQKDRRERAHDDDRINHREKQGRKKARIYVSVFLHGVTDNYCCSDVTMEAGAESAKLLPFSHQQNRQMPKNMHLSGMTHTTIKLALT